MTDNEFVEWRSHGIGASDIAGILQLSPWSSPYSVWASKVMPNTGGGELANAEAMRWGKLLEDAVIDEAARRLDLHVYGQQTRCTHPHYPWARATVDAFCKDDTGEGVVEAKTTGEPYWHDIPPYYEVQVLWQLEVTGRDYGWLAALHGGRRLSLWRVEAQPELQRAMVDTARGFWEAFVVSGLAPIVDGNPGTSDALDVMYPASEHAKVDLGDLAGEYRQLLRVRDEIKRLDRDKTALENTIKQAMGEADTGQIDGHTVVTWRTQTTRRVDVEVLRERYPAEAADCETVTESRRLLVKKIKAVLATEVDA